MYVVEYTTPKGERGIVETTKQGVTLQAANEEAERSNRQFKPLRYSVKEMAR